VNDELEAQVLASGFERDQLAVYADALQSSGDATDAIRGELIALDLHFEARATPDSDQRRRELLADWLGELALHVRCEWGFVHVALDRAQPDPHFLAKLLSSPGGPWLCGLELYGDQRFLRDHLSLLSIATRRRLLTLAVSQPVAADQPTISGRAATNLIRALPALDALAVRGLSVFGAFPHPTLRRLKVAGWTAVRSLAGDGGPLPALDELDFAFAPAFNQTYRPRDDQLDRLLRGVPALRLLDLSRNDRDNPYGRLPLFGFLRQLALKRRLTHLRVPAVYTVDERADLQYALDRMPDLVELEITRLPTPPANQQAPALDLYTPGTLIVPPPSRTHARGRDHLAIELVGHPRRLVVDLLDAVEAQEAEESERPRSRRSRRPIPDPAWEPWWRIVDRLGWDGQGPEAGLPQRAAVPLAVVAACAAHIDEPRWNAVRAAIAARPRPDDTPVTIRRAWTY